MIFRLSLALALLWACVPLWVFGQTDFSRQLADAAHALVQQRVVYDPSYYSIAYPGGDVPADRGVCTDVIIRAYRTMGIDLQKEVHEDMRKHFSSYPAKWGLKNTDRNIDHRRVPNLMVFFSRHGEVLPLSKNAKEYLPGDVVAWSLGGDVTHIGLISGKNVADGVRPLVVHNIGAGQVLEDMIFSYPIIGHYRYRK